MSPGETIVLRGEARSPGGGPRQAIVTLGADGFSVAVGDVAPWSAAYRDLGQVEVDGGTLLVRLGEGSGAERWLFERFGTMLGALARGFRDGRLRQWLTDGLLTIDDREPVELVEFAADAEAGVAQLLYHSRGVALAPLDERLPRLRIRRSDIGRISARPGSGSVQVAGIEGLLARGRALREAGGRETALQSIELRGLGASATSHEQRWSTLRDGAAADMATIVASLVPDAPFDQRRQAVAVLREGRPVDRVTLGGAWDALERAVLGEPTFAESYRSLVAVAGGPNAPRWLAIAPASPGTTETPRAWFLIGLPGNLVALELVSGGAHATYCFRVAPRAAFTAGAAQSADLDRAVREISEALLDARFLREPMALPDARLVEPGYLRYRLALEALPSLATARARFVARIVHRDPVSWRAALDDLIAWHGSARDEDAQWPGRAAQDAEVDEAETGAADPAEG